MRRITVMTLIVALLLTGLVWQSTAYAATIVVTPSNMNGWMWSVESGTMGTGEFVTGPAAPPSGSGSARITLGDAASGYGIMLPGFTGLRLDAISNISYSTYRTAGAPATAIAFQINIDYDLTDTNTAWQGRLVFEPYHAYGNPATGAWQTWDAKAGEWWSSGAPGNVTCPQSNPCTWAEVLAAFPNAGLHPTYGGILLKAGSNWEGFDGNVDAVNFNGNLYDFELTAPTAVVDPDAPPVPGCDIVIPMTDNAAMGLFIASTPAFWQPFPGSETNIFIEGGKSYMVMGMNEAKTFYQIVVSCTYVWVPAETVIAQPAYPWNSWPLPQTEVS